MNNRLIWIIIRRRSETNEPFESLGELKRMIDEDGLRGVTSNPTIFEKAITGSTDYTNSLKALERQNLDPKSIYEHLAIRDIQDAADVIRPVYEKTNRRDGYVCLGVSPYLAHDRQETVKEARRLWQSGKTQNAGRRDN